MDFFTFFGIPFVSFWNVLFKWINDPLISFLLSICFIAMGLEFLKLKFRKKRFVLQSKMNVYQNEQKKLEEKYAHDPEQLERKKKEHTLANISPLTPTLIMLRLLFITLCFLCFIIGYLMIFWYPNAFIDYNVVSTICSQSESDLCTLDISFLGLNMASSFLDSSALTMAALIFVTLIIQLVFSSIDRAQGHAANWSNTVIKIAIYAFFPIGLWIHNIIVKLISLPLYYSYPKKK